jgi:hypothetical protein
VTRQALTLELGGVDAPLLRAALLLHRDPRLRVKLRLVASPTRLPASGVLRIELGSSVHPLVTVLWGDEPADPSTAGQSEQAALGASAACWSTANRHESWYRIARSLPDWTRIGKPAARQPWVLLAPGAGVDAEQVKRLTGLPNAQLHFLSPFGATPARGDVIWWGTRDVLESLLGHVDAVVAPNGPLAWDAQRIGTPVFDPGTSAGVPLNLGLLRLARLVPQELVADAEFWRVLASGLLHGFAASDWGTLPWLRLARARSLKQMANPAVSQRIRRKLLKLRRDPLGFWADSKLAKLTQADHLSGR